MLALLLKMGFSKITMKISLQQIMVSTGAAIEITHTKGHLNDSQNYLFHMDIQEALNLAPGKQEHNWYRSDFSCNLKKQYLVY